MLNAPKKVAQPASQVPPGLSPIINATLAFCDGACKSNPGRGGFGAVLILADGEQIDIYGGEMETTNNRMELMGAIAALEHSPANTPIQIWTDSSYVKNGITGWIAGWKVKNWRKADGKAVINQALWQRLDIARQNREVSWHWLKGHAGHEGNEYADKLANLGVANLPTPITVKKSMKKKVLKSSPNLTSNATVSTPLVLDNLPDIDMKSNNHPINQSQNFSSQPYDSLNDIIFYDETQLIDEPPLHAPIYAQNTSYQNMPQDELINDDQFSYPQSSSVNQNQVQTNFPQTSLFQNAQGLFMAQDEDLIAQRPDFDGNTQTPNVFIPLLPLARHKNASNRQLILDTETTGFDAANGDRIIEIGIVELINRKFTGEKLHVYLNPNKEMGEEVIRIHGITNAFLADKPVFEQVGQVVYEFMLGAELIAHNAPFDMGFLVAEFNRLGLPDFASQVSVTDSLVIAKQQYAGQRNTLDALVKRLNVGKQDRTFHGALLDAEILAEVYLAMTGGQVALAIDDSVGGLAGLREHRRFSAPVTRFIADSASEQAHLAWIEALKGEHPALLDSMGQWQNS